MRVALWMNPLWRLVSKAAPSEADSRKRRSERHAAGTRTAAAAAFGAPSPRGRFSHTSDLNEAG
jgi:hypothetical protein